MSEILEPLQHRLTDCLLMDRSNAWTVFLCPLRHARKSLAGRSMIPDRVDISECPEIVELRARLGDWEGDTVFGQNAHLVTLG